MSPEGAGGPAIFLFGDTTQVLWAEEVAQEVGIPVEVIPAPVEADDLCGLALRTLPGRMGELAAALDDEGIPFQQHLD